MDISAKETAGLQQQWGDRPCDHPAFASEYATHPLHPAEDIRTGDYVCTTCGIACSLGDDQTTIHARTRTRFGMALRDLWAAHITRQDALFQTHLAAFSDSERPRLRRLVQSLADKLARD
jgi:hypothetical protein